MSLMRRRGTAAEAPSDPVTAHEEGAGYRSQPEERQAPGYRRPATGGEVPPRRSAGAATAGSLRSGAIVLASLVMGVATLIASYLARIGRSGLRYESRHGLRARRGEPV